MSEIRMTGPDDGEVALSGPITLRIPDRGGPKDGGTVASNHKSFGRSGKGIGRIGAVAGPRHRRGPCGVPGGTVEAGESPHAP